MEKKVFRKIVSSYVFILPVILVVGFFVFWPVMGTFISSLFQDATFLEKKFILFENYRQLFSDQDFMSSLRFNVLFVFVSVPLQVVLGLMFALVLNERIFGRGFLRALVLIPWVIPASVCGRIWELIYNYQFGLANFLLKIFPGMTPVNWLGTKGSAIFALVLSDTWKTTPFVTIILLAGLQSIPRELYEQAMVDRANFVQRFFWITLPLLRPVLAVAFLFRTIDAVRIFDLIYVLTGGGPGGGTTSLSYYGYNYFLSGDFGTGSAVSVVLFMVAFVLSMFYLKTLRFKEQLL